MTEYSNENTGVLFKNETDNEKAPMYKGKINVDGKEYELAAWLREAKSGKGKFLSLKVQEPRAKGEKKPVTFDDIDSDVPF
jgi:hypothetical protein